MTVGERIKARRKEIGISADVLAERIGVSRSTIFRYENGSIEKLPLPSLEPIARALHTSVQYLMGWDDEAKEKAPTVSGERKELADLIPYLPDEIIHALLALVKQAAQQK